MGLRQFTALPYIYRLYYRHFLPKACRSEVAICTQGAIRKRLVSHRDHQVLDRTMAGPISVEDMLAKQKAAKDAASKPKFLSKAERAAMALEKRNSDVKAQQEKDDEEKKDRIAFEQAAEEERRRQEDALYGAGSDGRYDRYGNRGYGRDDRYGNGYGPGTGYGQGGRSGHRDGPSRYQQNRNDRNGGPPSGPRGSGPPSGPRSSQNGFASHHPHASSPLANSSQHNGTPSSPKPTAPGDVALPTDAELTSIRARYLGQKAVEKKPRLRKEGGGNSKNVVFDWKDSEDTSGGDSTWMAQAQVQRVAAGRLNAEMAEANGKVEIYADPFEKRRAGKGTVDERNWRDKPLDAMKDRDWRILKEDFGIAARGGLIPPPLRGWRESTIPEKILDVVDEIGYKEPSPIQRQAIPIGLTERDLIGIAQTGT